MLYCNVPVSLATDYQQNRSSSQDLVHIFEFFNDKMERNEIESYTLSQTTLEHIFVRLVDEDERSCSVTA